MGLLQVEMGDLDMLDKEKAEALSDSFASVFKCPSHGKSKCRDWENEDLKPSAGEDQV